MASLKKEILEKYPNKYFVETGTHVGNSVQLALDCGFEKIITMEINPEKVEHAKALKLLDDRATFWLDAHWDDGPQGEYLCPLPIELEEIQKTSIKNHTLLIDDRRLFGVDNTTWGYTIDEDGILESISDINLDYKISYEDGCVPDDIIVAEVLK